MSLVDTGARGVSKARAGDSTARLRMVLPQPRRPQRRSRVFC